MDILQLPRQTGKTTRLIKEIKEAYDCGEYGVLIVESSNNMHMYRSLLLDAGVVHCRIITYHQLDQLRGSRKPIYAENVDLWPDGIYTLWMFAKELRLATSSESREGTLDWLDSIERYAKEERSREAQEAAYQRSKAQRRRSGASARPSRCYARRGPVVRHLLADGRGPVVASMRLPWNRYVVYEADTYTKVMIARSRPTTKKNAQLLKIIWLRRVQPPWTVVIKRVKRWYPLQDSDPQPKR